MPRYIFPAVSGLPSDGRPRFVRYFRTATSTRPLNDLMNLNDEDVETVPVPNGVLVVSADGSVQRFAGPEDLTTLYREIEYGVRVPVTATGPTANTGSGSGGVPGAAGLSAYQLAAQNGFSGSVSAWLASLVGQQGAPGSDGSAGSTGPQGPPGSAAVAKPAMLPYFRGVNVPGGEFAHEAATLPGVVGTDYAYPNAALFAFLAGRNGMSIHRLPFRWERVQNTLSGPLSLSGVAELDAAIDAAWQAGQQVILDCHNYARFISADDVERTLGDGVLTQAAFVDLWAKLAARYKSHPGVYAYGLMNEPHDISGGAAAWEAASQAAVTAIRGVGDKKVISVGTYSWSSAEFADDQHTHGPWITDPLHRTMYEAHLYFDKAGGTYPRSYTAENADAVSDGYANLTARSLHRLDRFATWLGTAAGYIGEIGWPNTTEWNAVGEAVYAVLDAKHIASSYWSVSDRWPNSYQLQAYAPGTHTTLLASQVIESHPGPRAISEALVALGDSILRYDGSAWVAYTAGGDSGAGTVYVDVADHGILPGSGDIGAALNALIEQYYWQLSNAARPGALFVMKPGVYEHSVPILMRSGIILSGAGANATELRAVASMEASVIFRASPDGVQPNTFKAQLRDLWINGNYWMNNGAGHGIKSVPNPLWSKGAGDSEFDTQITIENVLIRYTRGIGFYADGRGEHFLRNVVVREGMSHGFKPTADTHMVACVAGSVAGHGFWFTNASIRLVSCKAFYTGYSWDATLGEQWTNNHGFFVDAVNGGSVTAAGIEAQDCGGAGLAITNGLGHSFDISVDACARAGDSEHAAVVLKGARANVVTAVSTERFAPVKQVYALSIDRKSVGNFIEMTHRGNVADVGAALSSTSVNTENAIEVATVSMSGAVKWYRTSDAALTRKVILPLYTYPTVGDTWARVIKDHSGVAYVIVNDRSGNLSGQSADANFVTAINNLRNSGARFVYYVDTNFGATTEATVKANMDAWTSLYGAADGWFFDQASVDAAKVSYYQSLKSYGAGVSILNHGATPAESYLSTAGVADIHCIAEGTQATMASWTYPAWLGNYDPKRFMAITYSATDLPSAWGAVPAGVFHRVVTESPYFSGLPSFWASEQVLGSGTPLISDVIGPSGGDDTAAIQAAIDRGGIVRLAAGTFTLSSALVIKTGVTIQGVGMNATILKQTSPSANGIQGSDLSHAIIKDLRVAGPGATRGTGTGSGVSFTLTGTAGNATFYPELSNVYVENFGVDGVAIQTPIVARLSRVVAFKNNRHGINLWSTGDADGTSCHLSACFGAGNYGAGYNIKQMAYSALSACAADSNGTGYKYDTCIAVNESGCGSEEPYDFSAQLAGYVGYSRWIFNSKVTLSSPYSIGNIGTAYYITNGSVVNADGLFEGSPGNADSPTNNPTASIKVDAGCKVVLVNPNTTTARSLAAGTTTVLPDAVKTEYRYADYGIVADGSTDDTAGWTALMAAIGSNPAVVVGSGTWSVCAPDVVTIATDQQFRNVWLRWKGGVAGKRLLATRDLDTYTQQQRNDGHHGFRLDCIRLDGNSANVTQRPLSVRPTLTSSATTGTLVAGGYGYLVVPYTTYGDGLPSDTAWRTLGSTGGITLTWSAVTGVTGYRVYGRYNQANRPFRLLAEIPSGTTTWTDNGSVTPGTRCRNGWYDGSAGVVMHLHGYDFRVHDVEVINAPGTGAVSEWDGGTPAVGDRMEADFTKFGVTQSQASSFAFMGPHDSTGDRLIFAMGARHATTVHDNLVVGDGPLAIGKIHCWGAARWQSLNYGPLIVTEGEFEGGVAGQVKAMHTDSRVSGKVFWPGSSTAVGVKVGDNTYAVDGTTIAVTARMFSASSGPAIDLSEAGSNNDIAVQSDQTAGTVVSYGSGTNTVRITSPNGSTTPAPFIAGAEISMDPWGSTATTLGASGSVRLTYFTAVKGGAYTKLRSIAVGAAGATPTLCKMGIYSVASNGNLTLLAATASDTAMWGTANTSYERATTAGFTLVAGQRYAFAVLVVTSAAVPTLVGRSMAGSTAANTELARSPRKTASYGSQTDLPSTITYDVLGDMATAYYGVAA